MKKKIYNVLAFYEKTILRTFITLTPCGHQVRRNGIQTLSLINKESGNFGARIWCPALAKVVLDLGLKKFQHVLAEFEGECERKCNQSVSIL